jgi:hypothetical protein
MRSRLRSAAMTLLLGGVVATRCLAAEDSIGSWVLACPSETQKDICQLRHRNWILPPGTGGPAVALEVLRRGNRFVPAIVLRGLSIQAALGGAMALQANTSLGFDAAPQIELLCGLEGTTVVCAPRGADAADAASQLAEAHSVSVRARLGLPGGMSLPEQSRTLNLDRTRDAEARFGSIAPPSAATRSLPGLDWRGYLERLLQRAGS